MKGEEDRPPPPSSVVASCEVVTTTSTILRTCLRVRARPCPSSLQATTPHPTPGRLRVNARPPPVGSMFRRVVLLGPLRVVGGFEAMSKTDWGEDRPPASGQVMTPERRALAAVLRAYSAHVEGVLAPTSAGRWRGLLAAHTSCHRYLELIYIVSSICICYTILAYLSLGLQTAHTRRAG